jgi:hypothetical protein
MEDRLQDGRIINLTLPGLTQQSSYFENAISLKIDGCDALILANANFGTVGGMKVRFCPTAAACTNQVSAVLLADVPEFWLRLVAVRQAMALLSPTSS